MMDNFLNKYNLFYKSRLIFNYLLAWLDCNAIREHMLRKKKIYHCDVVRKILQKNFSATFNQYYKCESLFIFYFITLVRLNGTDL